jgi:hypothetical protein
MAGTDFGGLQSGTGPAYVLVTVIRRALQTESYVNVTLDVDHCLRCISTLYSRRFGNFLVSLAYNHLLILLYNRNRFNNNNNYYYYTTYSLWIY